MPWKDSIKKKYSAIKTGIKDNYLSPAAQTISYFVVDTVMQLYEAVDFLYHSPVVRKKVKDVVSQGWEGLLSTLRWDLLYEAITKSGGLRKFVGGSVFTNIVLYAGPVIVYEGYVKPGMRGLFPGIEEGNKENAYDYPMIVFFGTLFAGSLVKNLCYSAGITYHASAIAPKENFPACPHGAVEHLKADARSLVYYPRNLLTARFAYSLASPTFYMVAALAYGECIGEAKASLVGTCTEDRAKQFCRNNAYNFMVGVSFMLMTELLNMALTKAAWWKTDSTTGDFFIHDAAMSCILPIYIMLAILREKPLPGTEDGIDFFEFNRKEISERLARACNYAMPALMDQKIRDELKGYAVKIAQFPPVKFVARVLVGYVGLGLFPYATLYKNRKIIFSGKILAPEMLLQIPEFHALVEMHSASIKKGVGWLKFLQYARPASWLGAFVPSLLVSPHITGTINALAGLDEQFVKTIETLPKIAENITWEKKEGEVLDSYVSVPEKAKIDWDKNSVKLKRSQSVGAILKARAKPKLAPTPIPTIAPMPAPTKCKSDDWELVDKSVDKFVMPSKPKKTLPRCKSSPTIHQFFYKPEVDAFEIVEKPPEIKPARPMLVSRLRAARH